MNKLKQTTEKILQITRNVKHTEEEKKRAIDYEIRSYAASAINLALNIETTSLVGKDRDDRIKRFTNDYGITEDMNGQFY